MQSTVKLLLALLPLSVTACFEDFDTGTIGDTSDIPNGTNLNGTNLNGTNLNGTNLNGTNLNGQSLGQSLQWASYGHVQLAHGGPLSSVSLDGSQLVGREHGRDYAGADFAGASLTGRSDTGREVKLQITGVHPPDPGSDVWHYDIEYRDHDHHWYPLCHDDQLHGWAAIAVDGWWDYSQGTATGGAKTIDGDHFTFACPLIGAIGKCVDAGYEPWDDALEPYHESCVRLLRADYCGDGISHTTNGARVNIYDDVGVQSDTENWTTEGEWDADGARCITPHIRESMPVTCYNDKLSATCGDPPDFAGGTMIVSETP